MASVRLPNEPSLIAVVARDSFGIRPAQGGGQFNVHVGYEIITDEAGNSEFKLLVPAARADAPSVLDVRSRLLGDHLTARATVPLGTVALNEGRLPSRTGLGPVTLLDRQLTFPAVVIDVTGKLPQRIMRLAA